jgi:hypothetical protein
MLELSSLVLAQAPIPSLYNRPPECLVCQGVDGVSAIAHARAHLGY